MQPFLEKKRYNRKQEKTRQVTNGCHQAYTLKHAKGSKGCYTIHRGAERSQRGGHHTEARRMTHTRTHAHTCRRRRKVKQGKEKETEQLALTLRVKGNVNDQEIKSNVRGTNIEEKPGGTVEEEPAVLLPCSFICLIHFVYLHVLRTRKGTHA